MLTLVGNVLLTAQKQNEDISFHMKQWINSYNIM